MRALAIIYYTSLQKLSFSIFNIEKGKDILKKHFFVSIAILLALLFWLLDSTIRYYWSGELEFEIIASDNNVLWMKSALFIMLTSFGFFADFTSRRTNETNKINILADNISRAKKQWEVIVDSLPQLVVAIDHDARITRVNRTIEKWGVGKVNKVEGLYIQDFLRCLNKDFTTDDWISDWPNIWQQISKRNLINRKIKKENIGKTYNYTLQKIPDYDIEEDQCFAVLFIDDITTLQDIEESLKSHAHNLETQVKKRTMQLKYSNEKLEKELLITTIAKEELKKSQKCRLNLLRDLFSSQETERKRIACELHDSIGQSLGATKFKIEELLINRQNFIDDDEYDQFNNLVETIKDSISEVRHIAMDLRPAMLDDLGALATLNWFCREFKNTYTGITIKLLLHVDESDISFDKKIVIFRIVQEALNNVVKHADATNIVLGLSKTDAGLKLRISDDGCGFDMASLNNKNIDELNKEDSPPKCSFGLNSMRERAESTNGVFSIETAPDAGTRVNVSWKNQTPAFVDA